MDASLTDQRIWLTGGRGCLAGVVNRHCAARGAQVSLFSREPDAHHRALDELLAPGALARADLLLHLAWSTVPFSAEPLPDGGQAEDLGLLNRLLERLGEIPADRRPHLVFFSSGGTVYGNARNDRASRESDPCTPVGRHGDAKLAAEHQIVQAGRRLDFPWTILRISNPYGFPVPAGRRQGIIPVALDCARTGRPLSLWGDGTARKDFLHHTDFCAALEHLLVRRATGIFNLCHGESHSLRELLTIIEQATGGRVALQHEPAHPWDVHDSLLDNRKLCAATQWRPSVSLAEGIARMAAELPAS